MLGCNESNIIFQQHLGQLRRSNSQVLGQAKKKRPTGHYKKYSHFKGRDTAPAAWWGAVYRCRFGREDTRINTHAPHAQFYHVTVRWRCEWAGIYSGANGSSSPAVSRLLEDRQRDTGLFDLVRTRHVRRARQQTSDGSSSVSLYVITGISYCCWTHTQNTENHTMCQRAGNRRQ